jgi:hypothetical protein
MLDRKREVPSMLRRALYAAGAIALGLLLTYGCERTALQAAQVTIVDAEVREWTNPDDGKVYLAVAPTWRNDGPEDVRSVWILVSLKGPKGEFPSEVADPDKSPYVLYSGDPVAAGSTVHPSDSPDTFAVLGPKDEVLVATGPGPTALAEVVASSAEAVDRPTADPPSR